MTNKIAISLLAIFMLSVSCTQDEVQESQPVQPQPVPLCTYTFDGEEFDVYTVRFSENDNTIMFSFSPLQPEEEQTTYAVVGISRHFLGKEIDVRERYHNDEYYFTYEDPVCYYSQYWQLDGGTIKIADIGNGQYFVHVDVILPDGKSFTLEYDETPDVRVR